MTWLTRRKAEKKYIILSPVCHTKYRWCKEHALIVRVGGDKQYPSASRVRAEPRGLTDVTAVGGKKCYGDADHTT